ncbi:MAG: glycerophosphodiester phosphodiesterase [Omnitrophica WOR_2 bacterium]
MRKRVRFGLGAVTALVAAGAGMALLSRRAGESSYFLAGMPKPLVISHQGGDRVWPGNTMYAFQKSVEMGVDVIETDLRRTKDGVLVISHDESVDRISNGKGLITDLTFDELKGLDAAYNWSTDGGKSFPYRGQGITYTSLDEVFKTFPEMRFNVDMKQAEPPMEEAFCQLIRRYQRRDITLAASFSHKTIAAFRKLCPEVTTAADETETRNFVFLNFAYLGRLYSPAFKAFQVPVRSGSIPIITRHFVEAAHERNLRVDVWTVDDPKEMKYLIDLGVDGIMSDRPDLLMEVVGR